MGCWVLKMVGIRVFFSQFAVKLIFSRSLAKLIYTNNIESNVILIAFINIKLIMNIPLASIALYDLIFKKLSTQFSTSWTTQIFYHSINLALIRAVLNVLIAYYITF